MFSRNIKKPVEDDLKIFDTKLGKIGIVQIELPNAHELIEKKISAIEVLLNDVKAHSDLRASTILTIDLDRKNSRLWGDYDFVIREIANKVEVSKGEKYVEFNRILQRKEFVKLFLT